MANFVIIVDGVSHRRESGSLRRTWCGLEPRSWTVAEAKSRPNLPRCPECGP